MAIAALVLAGVMAIPATAAEAARPKAGSPKRPVVMGADIEGSADLTNYCGGIKCETYLELQVRSGSTWQLETYSRESNQFGVQTIDTTAVPGHKYRTAVVDFTEVATPDGCGPSSKVFGGVRYRRFLCLADTTLYIKTWVSASTTVPTDA